MKFKNFISRSLALSIFLSTCSINSKASYAMEDRYETFKGSSISITDNYDVGEKDVVIKGNTLVNRLSDITLISNKNTTTYNKQSNTITIEHASEQNDNSKVRFGDSVVEAEKTYTLIFDIIENTLSRAGSDYVGKFNIVSYNHGLYEMKNSDIGLKKIVLPQSHIATHDGKPYFEVYATSVGKIVIKDIVLLEGDWSNEDVSTYFEGMKSVGEKEDGNHGIEIKSKNKNLFDMNDTVSGFLGASGNIWGPDYNNRTSNYIKVKPNTTYFYTLENYTNNVGLWSAWVYYKDDRGNVSDIIQERQINTTSTYFSFTTPSDCNYIRIGSRCLEDENVIVSLEEESFFGNNLFRMSDTVSGYLGASGSIWAPDYNNRTSNYIKVAPNTTYYYLASNLNSEISNWTGWFYYKNNKGDISSIVSERQVIDSPKNQCIYFKFTTPSDCNYIRIGSRFLESENVKVYLGERNIYEYQENSSQIELNEPLRGLPNGVSDKIVKKNGQWYIERNIKEITLGVDNFSGNLIDDKYQNDETIAFSVNLNDRKILKTQKENNAILSDKLLIKEYSQIIYSNELEGLFSDSNYRHIYCRFKKDRLSGYDLNMRGIRDYLTDNPIKLLYELENPIYEPLNSSSVLNLYEEVAFLSNDSVIPAKMEVVVDRVYNISKRYIENAILNPTVDNINLARIWINQAPESTLKDLLQSNLSDIFSKDITLERKTVTSNVDVYVKSENALSLSLNTNNITFDGYSGVEDMEMLNAVELTVSSSLPYKVNAYLASEIQNADKTKTIDKSTLKIKANNKQSYNTFNDTISPVVLLDDQNKGNGISHGIDLKLQSNLAHKADVYKTTLKFEVEQK